MLRQVEVYNAYSAARRARDSAGCLRYRSIRPNAVPQMRATQTTSAKLFNMLVAAAAAVAANGRHLVKGGCSSIIYLYSCRNEIVHYGPEELSFLSDASHDETLIYIDEHSNAIFWSGRAELRNAPFVVHSSVAHRDARWSRRVGEESTHPFVQVYRHVDQRRIFL